MCSRARGTARSFCRGMREDVRRDRQHEIDGLGVGDGSTGGERRFGVPSGPIQVAPGQPDLGAKPVQLPRVVMGRAGLDLGELLVDRAQRLVPVAEPVPEVRQRRSEPARLVRRADLLGESRRLETRTVARPEVAERLVRDGQRVVAPGQRPEHAGVDRHLDRALDLVETAAIAHGTRAPCRSGSRAALIPCSQPSSDASASAFVASSSSSALSPAMMRRGCPARSHPDARLARRRVGDERGRPVGVLVGELPAALHPVAWRRAASRLRRQSRRPRRRAAHRAPRQPPGIGRR